MNRSGISFALVGPGRAGQSLLQALSGSSWHCRGIYRRGDDLSGAAQDVDVVILAVSDDAISSVARSIAPSEQTVVLHLSGAKTLGALAPHQRRASVHPLVSLPNPMVGAARLTDHAAFAVAGDALARQLVEALEGRWFDVRDEDRSLYHATAAIASNHLVALCAQVDRLASHLAIPTALFHDLMASTLDNVRQSGAVAALTGPASRGDTTTVDEHLAALVKVADHEVDLYQAWANEAGRLGVQGRRQPPFDDEDPTA